MSHDVSTLRNLLRYEPETGKLFWLERPLEMFATAREQPARSWNSRWAGREALTAVDTGGHKMGRIAGEYWQAHRVAWVLHYGSLPSGSIDHINGDPADNRITNLREVTHPGNMRNQRRRGSSASGVMGVTFDSRSGRWRASISSGNQFRSLGLHDTIEAAARVRRAEEQKLGFDPNHGRQAGGRRP
jgi:hypothetical protein